MRKLERDLKEFIARLTPTEEERLVERLLREQSDERWASFGWGLLFASIFWLIIIFSKNL